MRRLAGSYPVWFKDMKRKRNLEMAHIRLEAALETSDKWHITDASLLRWRRKLKRAAQECDDTVNKCKQRILEDEQMEEEVRSFSFPRKIAHATKSFVFSVFNHSNKELSRPIVQRFEWFADGASEFLRFVELGGTPRRHMPFDPLIRHLLAGKKLEHTIIQANKCPLILLLAPFATAEHGIEGRLTFMQKDGDAPDDGFCLSVMLQLSESTDIIGIAVKCLQLFAPLFKSTVENIRQELMQLPTQGFSWVPYADGQKEHWDNLHRFSTQWFRPNPLCCKEHDQRQFCHGSKLDKSGLRGVSLEPVIAVYLQCQVSLSVQECLSECRSSLRDHPYLKAGLLFTPHNGSSEDMSPVEQHCLHTDFTLGELEGIMLPKAIDHFRQNDEATVYHMLWRSSKNGTAYVQVEKASVLVKPFRRGTRKRKLLQGQDEALGCPTQNWISRFIDLWATYAPIQLQGSIMGWNQEEKEKQLAAHHYYRLKS